MLDTRIDHLTQHIDTARRGSAVDLRDRRILTRNMLFLHDCVVASEQLLIDAELATQCGEPDPYRGALGCYYLSHLDEERGHLQWLRDDLAALGVVSNDPPDALAMGMIGTQYYMLKHVHPATLLGYLAVIEGEPTPLEVVEQLEAIHGASVLGFIREHAIKDPEHRIELFALIAEAPEDVYPAIRLSADHVLSCLTFAANQWMG